MKNRVMEGAGSPGMNESGGVAEEAGNAMENGSSGVPAGEATQANGQESMSFEQFQAMVGDEVMQTIVGGSGGIGGVPETVMDAKVQAFTPSDFLQSMKRGEYDALSLEAKVEAFHSANRRFIPIMGNAQTILATIAVVLGAMANTIKTEVGVKMGPKAWTNFRRAHFDLKIHPNTLKVYMDIAAITNVEKYLGLGVERLGKLGAFIANSNLQSDDPIKYILTKLDKDYSVHMPVEDFKIRCDAALINHRLQAKGLDIPFETLVQVRECGVSLDSADIDEMVHRKKLKQSPVAYLVQLMDAPEDRNELLTHKKSKPKGAKSSRTKSGRVQDINSAVQDLDETVSGALALEVIETPLEDGRIERLINNLRKLQEKVRTQAQAA